MRDELSFDYGAAAPEILLAVASMALLMYGVFRPAARAARETAWLAVAALLVTLVVTLALPEGRTVTFAGAFVVDGFAVYVKALILIGSVAVLLMSIDVFQRDDMDRFELPVLMVIATLGMMMMVSANDLISLYISVGLQSLALYVCAAVKRDSLRSTEAGLKYFMLGALSSGMLLYGASLIYGFTGTTSFEVLAAVGTAMQDIAVLVRQVRVAWEEPDRLHRGLQGAKSNATALSAVRRRGWAQSVGEREPGAALFVEMLHAPEQARRGHGAVEREAESSCGGDRTTVDALGRLRAGAAGQPSGACRPHRGGEL